MRQNNPIFLSFDTTRTTVHSTFKATLIPKPIRIPSSNREGNVFNFQENFPVLFFGKKQVMLQNFDRFWVFTFGLKNQVLGSRF